MRKLRGSLAAKITAIVLLCLLVLVFIASVLGALILSELGAYSGGYESARQNMLTNLCRDRAMRAAERIVEWGDDAESVYAHENFRFTIYDADRELLYSNYDGEGFLAHVSYTHIREEYEPVPSPEVTAIPPGTPGPRLLERDDADPSVYWTEGEPLQRT